MSALDKAMDVVGIPKRIYDSVEKFSYALFGKFVNESGELLADRIRFQRLKNQIKIFEKAKAFIGEAGLQPNQINIKLLVPLLENISLESNEKVQDRWARVISNICFYDTDQAFDLKCIEIMKDLSDKELILIDLLYEDFLRAKEAFRLHCRQYACREFNIGMDHEALTRFERPFTLEMGSINISEWNQKIGVSQSKIELYFERLLSYNLLKIQLPLLEEGTDETQDAYGGRVPINSYELKDSQRVQFTNLGLYFVELCKFPNGIS